MTEDIITRLNEACIGHPHARIAWPHRLLHDAIKEIETLRAVAETDAVAPPVESDVREALRDVQTWCDAQGQAIGAVDGYDYRSGEEYAYRNTAIEIGKRLAALSTPRTQSEPVALLRERLLNEGAVSFSTGSTPSYFNCEDNEEGAVIPIPVKLRDDLAAFLAASPSLEDMRRNEIIEECAKVSAVDFAKEANDLKQALADNAYPAADGTADIDNHALPIIEVTLRNLVERALSLKNGTTRG